MRVISIYLDTEVLKILKLCDLDDGESIGFEVSHFLFCSPLILYFFIFYFSDFLFFFLGVQETRSRKFPRISVKLI